MLEDRYIVLKYADVRNLDPKAQAQLTRLCAAVDFVRELRGAEPIQAVVVEHDWPEYPRTVRSILRRTEETVSRRQLLLEIVLGAVLTAAIWTYVLSPVVNR